MKTLKDFTPEVQAKIPEYIKKYTEGVFDGGRYNKFNSVDAENLINWNYEKCGFKKPVMLVAENPYEMQIFFNYIKAKQEIFAPILYVIYCLKNKIELPKEFSQLRSQLGSQLGSQLYSQLYSQLRSQLRSQLDSQLRSQLGSQLDSQLRSQLGSQLDSQLRSQLDSQLGKYNEMYLWTCNIYSNCTAAWYKFMKDELKIDCEICVTLDSWNGLYEKSNIYSAIFSELVCVVSKYPKKVHRNNINNLHNINSSAVEWGKLTDITNFDGHYFNGLRIEKDLFYKLANKSYTFDDWTKEKNEEIKSLVLAFYEEKFGGEFVYRFLSKYLKEIDAYVDKKESKYLKNTVGMNVGVYTLFKGNLNGIDISYIRCYCPSTDRLFFLGVHPDTKTAKDAIASLCQVPAKLHSHLTSISRQGEMFSFNFDEKGTEMLKEKKLSKQDYQDVVSLKGTEYFSKIKFEY